MDTLLERFFNLVGLNKKESLASKHELYGLDNLDDDAIGHPPTPLGIPVVQTKVILDRMKSEVDKIKHEIGVDRQVFEEYLSPVFENFIRYADLLPASEYKHHHTGGGLVAHSLDVAHRCMRAAQMTHFPVTTGTLTETQQSNVQWRVATVLAGLLHDGGKVLADVQVHDGKGAVYERIVWDAQSDQTIHDWAAEHNIERYYISWNRDRHLKHQNASLVVMERLIPSKTWSWLEGCCDGKQIHHMMLASVGKTDLSHPMPKIVAEADSASTRADMFSRSSHITKELKRIPISEMLCDLMKHYLMKDTWKVNEKNAYVWFVDDHLYVVWNNAVPDLIQEISDAGYRIPKIPEVLARVMIEEGQAVSNGDELYFDIYPEILGDSKKPVKINVLRLRNVARIILEPEKLYSLKQHKKRPLVQKNQAPEVIESKEQEGVVNKEIIDDIFDDELLDASYTRSRATKESSKQTLARVLKNIRAAMVERAKAQQIQKIQSEPVIQVDEPEYVDPKYLDENIEEPLEPESLLEPDYPHTISEPPSKGEIKEHQKSETAPEKESTPLLFTNEIPLFLQKHFDFSIDDDQRIQIPDNALVEIMKKAEVEGADFSLLELMESQEINIYG
ncbi:MobH family relaxase [Vibrio coralliilyticus]|uniref:Uncharacterized domain-containing protein n=1 Tax=Vibrio coralliilyticus TaxID=190893 RepID=A0AAP6ZVQ7_9VIBR|nr:hypothetical protein [Vibrio coralliilyticus]NOJ25274.1 hypothetical protein [Vibrio coralliilyticus]